MKFRSLEVPNFGGPKLSGQQNLRLTKPLGCGDAAAQCHLASRIEAFGHFASPFFAFWGPVSLFSTGKTYYSVFFAGVLLPAKCGVPLPG